MPPLGPLPKKPRPKPTLRIGPDPKKAKPNKGNGKKGVSEPNESEILRADEWANVKKRRGLVMGLGAGMGGGVRGRRPALGRNMTEPLPRIAKETMSAANNGDAKDVMVSVPARLDVRKEMEERKEMVNWKDAKEKKEEEKEKEEFQEKELETENNQPSIILNTQTHTTISLAPPATPLYTHHRLHSTPFHTLLLRLLLHRPNSFTLTSAVLPCYHRGRHLVDTTVHINSAFPLAVLQKVVFLFAEHWWRPEVLLEVVEAWVRGVWESEQVSKSLRRTKSHRATENDTVTAGQDQITGHGGVEGCEVDTAVTAHYSIGIWDGLSGSGPGDEKVLAFLAGVREALVDSDVGEEEMAGLDWSVDAESCGPDLMDIEPSTTESPGLMAPVADMGLGIGVGMVSRRRMLGLPVRERKRERAVSDCRGTPNIDGNETDISININSDGNDTNTNEDDINDDSMADLFGKTPVPGSEELNARDTDDTPLFAVLSDASGTTSDASDTSETETDVDVDMDQLLKDRHQKDNEKDHTETTRPCSAILPGNILRGATTLYNAVLSAPSQSQSSPAVKREQRKHKSRKTELKIDIPQYKYSIEGEGVGVWMNALRTAKTKTPATTTELGRRFFELGLRTAMGEPEGLRWELGSQNDDETEIGMEVDEAMEIDARMGAELNGEEKSLKETEQEDFQPTSHADEFWWSSSEIECTSPTARLGHRDDHDDGEMSMEMDSKIEIEGDERKSEECETKFLPTPRAWYVSSETELLSSPGFGNSSQSMVHPASEQSPTPTPAARSAPAPRAITTALPLINTSARPFHRLTGTRPLATSSPSINITRRTSRRLARQIPNTNDDTPTRSTRQTAQMMDANLFLEWYEEAMLKPHKSFQHPAEGRTAIMNAVSTNEDSPRAAGTNAIVSTRKHLPRDHHNQYTTPTKIKTAPKPAAKLISTPMPAKPPTPYTSTQHGPNSDYLTKEDSLPPSPDDREWYWEKVPKCGVDGCGGEHETWRCTGLVGVYDVVRVNGRERGTRRVRALGRRWVVRRRRRRE